MKRVAMMFIVIWLGTGCLWAQEKPKSSRRFLWSMAFGAGSGGLTGFTQDQKLNKSATYAFDFQFGYVINDFTYICLDLAAVPQADLAWPGTEVDYLNYSAGITYFPLRPVYIRLGPSIGFLEGGKQYGLEDRPGFGFMTGAGVQFDIGVLKKKAQFSVIGGIQYFYHSYGEYYAQSNLMTLGLMMTLDLTRD